MKQLKKKIKIKDGKLKLEAVDNQEANTEKPSMETEISENQPTKA